MRGSNAGRRTIAAADVARNTGNHGAHVAGQFAVMHAEAQIQFPLARIVGQFADQIAFGCESFKPL